MGVLYTIWASHTAQSGKAMKYLRASQLFEIAMLKNRIISCELFYYVIKPQIPYLKGITFPFLPLRII